MSVAWPALDYEQWSETCDTLHAYAQLLGKFSAALAPAEPLFQHIALRLTARGWETLPLPAPDGSGALAVALDLRSHEAVVEHSERGARRLPLGSGQSVGSVTRGVLGAAAELAGEVRIDPTPQEVHWKVALDEDEEHSVYDASAVERYFALASQAALTLTAFRARHAGRCTPVNAWWGSFDVAVSLFSDAGDELAVGWWPGDPRYPKAAFYAYARPSSPGFERATLSPDAARWEAELGEFILDNSAVVGAAEPDAVALNFARSAQRASALRE